MWCLFCCLIAIHTYGVTGTRVGVGQLLAVCAWIPDEQWSGCDRTHLHGGGTKPLGL